MSLVTTYLPVFSPLSLHSLWKWGVPLLLWVAHFHFSLCWEAWSQLGIMSWALQGAVEEMWALWSPREASFESPNMTFPLWEAQEAEQMDGHLSLKKNGKVCH